MSPTPHHENYRYPVKYLAAHERCHCDQIAEVHGFGTPHPNDGCGCDQIAGDHTIGARHPDTDV